MIGRFSSPRDLYDNEFVLICLQTMAKPAKRNTEDTGLKGRSGLVVVAAIIM